MSIPVRYFRLFSTCVILAVMSVIPDLSMAVADYDESAEGRQSFYYKSAQGTPNTQYLIHKTGKMAVTISNMGTFGTSTLGTLIVDGEIAPSCEYPINTDLEYLFQAGLWIGAVVGRDTMVSVAADGWFQMREFWPDEGERGGFIVRSNLKSKPEYSDQAKSEQDFICTYTDTFTDLSLTGEDPIDNRPHIPLNLSIRQGSYAWSYDYAEDFIIFDYRITNIGTFPLRDVFIGVYLDGVAYHRSIASTGFTDDICGFRRTVVSPGQFCIEEDTVNIAWIADNDGDPVGNDWAHTSTTAVTGVRVLRTPNDDLQYSFNWWISNGNSTLDFGPRTAGSPDDPFRPFGTHLGTPTGDRNKYYVMSHQEFDYDQLFTAISHTDEGYLRPPPPHQAVDFADGYDTRYLLSFGPFDIRPGDSLPITLAYVAGDSFHVRPNDYAEYFDATNPQPYYDRLNFRTIGDNSRWASWIFDNPGVDTDGDGDSGRYCWRYIWRDTSLFNPDSSGPVDSAVVDSEKVYYVGDGVADFRGASPPVPPAVRTVPGLSRVTLRWNGQLSEHSIDPFSGHKDFEGYTVYFAEGDRLTDFVQLASYDIENYAVYKLEKVLTGYQEYYTLEWRQLGMPLTLDSLHKRYGPDFDPDRYPDPDHFYFDRHMDEYIFFRPQGWNDSELNDPLKIHRVYPDASPFDDSDTTEDGYLRYYEYEYTIDNLRPTQPYFFSVTTFDHGSTAGMIGAMESSPLVNAVREFALPGSEAVEENELQVVVYPNPYRIDGGYANAGYENRDRTRAADWARRIHFANLPSVCTIRIYTISGDLVQQIDHNYPGGGPGSQHEEWNLVSKNTQAVVTGIYIWSVTSDMGEQLGKLVIIK